MANVFDTAKYILNKTGSVSTWKLQKLCFYAQAWSIAWTDEPLFEEDFQAWRNGPVCPVLFQQHKGKFIVKPDDIEGFPCELTADEKDTVDKVLEHYGDWEPYKLREQTHEEEPWKAARGDLPADAHCENVISKDSMGLYYGAL